MGKQSEQAAPNARCSRALGPTRGTAGPRKQALGPESPHRLLMASRLLLWLSTSTVSAAVWSSSVVNSSINHFGNTGATVLAADSVMFVSDSGSHPFAIKFPSRTMRTVPL